MSDENKVISDGVNFGPTTGRDSVDPASKKLREAGIELHPAEPTVDRLEDMFRRQEEFMQLLKEADKLPEWPIDIISKYGQRQIKEIIWSMVEEMAEASFVLKNRMHRFTDHADVDFEHFREELGDALAYFMEICIMVGISPAELYEEYCRKNAFVKKRAREGY
jgi:NTP pyrophosphatase (non-canonical NTP hydrolase)